MDVMPPGTRRRWLVAGAVAAVAACGGPGVRAQAVRKPRRVGLGFQGRPETVQTYIAAFHQGMQAMGLQPEQDYVLVQRHAMGRPELYARVMAELLDARAEVLVVAANTMTWAAKSATSTLPIVMALSADPEATGLVASLARPGGNVTGVSLLTASVVGKRLQLLRELVPGATRWAYLTNPKIPGWDRVTHLLEDAASRDGLRLSVLHAASAEEIDRVLTSLATHRPDALVVGSAAIFHVHRRRIIEHCAALRLPASYGASEAVVEGGLTSYSASITQAYERAAYFVARILAGARPADLPVEQPTRFELAINQGTARTLGLTIPGALLATADIVVP